MHNLNRGKIRGEKITRKLINQLKTKKGFQAFITKCYAECDIDKKYKIKITKGRISYQNIADYFNVSRVTTINNIKQSGAKLYKNIRMYPNIKFKTKSEFYYWLTQNLSNKIGDYVMENNPNSYRLKFINGYYILTQEMPNIYKFTGVYLVNERDS